MFRDYGQTFSRKCFYVTLAAAVSAAVVYAAFYVAGISLLSIGTTKCLLYETTGFYCPGCGGTRAVSALIHGNVFKSLFYHPSVFPSFLIGIYYLLSHTVSIFTNGKVKGMAFRPFWLYLIAGLVILQWIVKNAIYVISGIHVI